MGNGSGTGSNPLSAFASQIGNAFSGLTGGNQFGGDASTALSGDTSGMSGFDVASLFSNLPDQTFNEDTASIQATQAITPPAQAQANAATGQDPSAGIGGTQTGAQTASTGPGNQPNQPSQEQQDQEQRNRAIDELRRQLRQRQKQQQEPPQWNPRYAAAAMQTSGTNWPATPYVEGPSWQREYGPPGYHEGESNQPEYGPGQPGAPYPEGESNQAEYGPGTPGAPYPEGPDYQTEYGHELNLPRPGAPALPAPDGPGRQIIVRPRVPLPARIVPGTPGAPGTPETLGHPDFVADPGHPDFVADPPRTPPGGALVPGQGPASGTPGGVPGLPGLGLPGLGLLPWILRGALGGVASVPFTATPAETGELPEKYWPKPATEDTAPDPEQPGPEDPEIRARQRKGMSPGQRPDQPAPPAGAAPKRKDQPKPKPKAADPPRRVWVPETPGHYIPTPGNARGQPTWVKGTPGHYAEVAPAGGQRRTPEAAQRLSAARAEAPEVMAYNQEARLPTMLRDILGLGVLPGLAAIANEGRQLPRNTPSNVYGQGGTRPYNENWGGRAYVAKGDEVQRGRQYMGYLTNKGLTRQGAAALLGNAHQESNLSATLAPGGDGGTAAGMFQWRGPRQAAFREWLRANGRSESDPQAHLDFALYEMQTNPAYRASWEALHNPNMSPAQIADVIANNYEGSKRGPTQGMNNRIGFANSMLQGGGTATTVPMPIQASGGDAQG